MPSVTAHGNSKSDKAFYPTLPSTVQHIKSECVLNSPKEVVASVSSTAGGIVGAGYPGELPRNEQQVSNFKQRKPRVVGADTAINMSVHTEANDLYTIMLQAHLEDTNKKFARDIKAYPEPAILLASDHQLNDVSRFCCDPFDYCVLTVDPTFSLGDFDVTPTTYRHLLLECRRSGKPPVMIGPTLIHYRKTFQTYLFFASSMIGLRKELEHLRAFGTDGEKALCDAFSHEFRFAVHLTCFIHVRRNVKDELLRRMIPDALRSEILDDLFGKKVGSTQLEGLVDCADEGAFDEKLRLLVQKWKSHEESNEAVSDMCEWLFKNKVDVIRRTMLRSVREEAGLGCPPDAFYTNASECVNSIIKVKVEYKRSELPQFICKLHELCEEQKREVERAVICRGKFRLRPQYRHLEVSENKWFKMTREQRTQHLKRVDRISVSDITRHDEVAYISDLSGPSHSDMGMSDGSGPSSSSMSDEQEVTLSSISHQLVPLSPHLGLPAAAIEAISRKAVEILMMKDGIVPAPGHDPKARMVVSKSHKRPHLVLPKKNGGMACDDDCPQYKSCGLCSHVVAAAQHNDQLSPLVSSYRKIKRTPNLTRLATSEMPKGRGRKGGKAPAKHKPTLPVEARYELNSTMPVPSSTTVTSCPFTMNARTVNASIVSPASTFQCIPPYPPIGPSPMIQPYNMDPSHGGQHPFRVCYVAGNISVCHGCKGSYAKEAGPPHDLCIQHEEWRTFTNSGSGTVQSRFGNVYYHCSPACIFAVWPSFVPSSLHIPSYIHSQLGNTHKEWIYSQFGVYIP